MPDPSSNGADRINCYALVAYIPGILGSFFDQLRSDLEPNSLAPRAHLTILPPRGLAAGVEPLRAWSELQRKPLWFFSPLASKWAGRSLPGNQCGLLLPQPGWDELQDLHKASGQRLPRVLRALPPTIPISRLPRSFPPSRPK